DAQVELTVNAVNDAPVVRPDTFDTDEDTAITGNVLANDEDVDHDLLNAELDENPEHGAAVVNADGSFTYTPEADYHGPDSFTYRALDGQGGDVVGRVDIVVHPVNDAPKAEDDTFT